jgi:hypothetical protein
LHNTLHSTELLESVRLTNQKHAIYDQKLTPYGGVSFWSIVSWLRGGFFDGQNE